MPFTRATDDDRPSAPAADAADDLTHLTTALEADDPAARRAAARACQAHPALAPLLADRITVEADDSVRRALCSALSAIGTPAAVRGLMRCLQSPTAAVRADVLDALQGIPEATAPVLAPWLTADDVALRRFVMELLPSLRHPQVAEWALTAVRVEPDPNVAAAAAELLGDVGGIEARDALVALGHRFADHPFVAFVAEQSIARLDAA